MSEQIKLGSFFYYKDVEYDAWYHFDDKRRVYAPHHQSLALDLVAELDAERDSANKILTAPYIVECKCLSCNAIRKHFDKYPTTLSDKGEKGVPTNKCDCCRIMGGQHWEGCSIFNAAALSEQEEKDE